MIVFAVVVVLGHLGLVLFDVGHSLTWDWIYRRINTCGGVGKKFGHGLWPRRSRRVTLSTIHTSDTATGSIQWTRHEIEAEQGHVWYHA